MKNDWVEKNNEGVKIISKFWVVHVCALEYIALFCIFCSTLEAKFEVSSCATLFW